VKAETQRQLVPGFGRLFKMLPLFAVVLVPVTQLYADTFLTYNVSGTVNGDTESAKVVFDIGNCGVNECQLNVTITNNVVNPSDIGFGIIGVSFNIGNLTGGGTLKVNGSSQALVTNGSGGNINSILFGSPTTVTSTNLAPDWGFAYGSDAHGCLANNAFCLGDQTGGKPINLILGSGPYSGQNNSFAQAGHNPDLEGPVEFEIDQFTELSLTSTFSNVMVDFGTNPDGSLAGTMCTTGCTGAPGGGVPEPVTPALAGSGLLLLGWLGRRISLSSRSKSSLQ
jgi:hypothetical protein